MMRMLLLIVGLLLVSGLHSEAKAQVSDDPLYTSRYTNLDDCTVVESSVEPDFVLHRCEGIEETAVWLRYSDSARLYLSFGKEDHGRAMFGIDRDPEWPIEWRGSVHMMRFEPFAVIIRMNAAFAAVGDEPEPSLSVFKLNRDGTSCLIESSLQDNERARQIADRTIWQDCP